MKSVVSRILACALLVVLAVVVPPARPAGAGQSFSIGFDCSVVNGSPTCTGSLRGAALSPGTGDFAFFRLNSTGIVNFFASFSGANYACSFGTTASQRLSPAVIAADVNTYFSVVMNTAGSCTSAFFDNNSAYQSSDRP
jgi:hypothetical protein